MAFPFIRHFSSLEKIILENKKFQGNFKLKVDQILPISQATNVFAHAGAQEFLNFEDQERQR